MRLPAPLMEHPVESLIAGLLLAALLFVSAGPEPASSQTADPARALAQKF